MRKIILFALTTISILAFVLTGCKKEANNTGDTEYYLKFKINGSWVLWTNAVAELGADLDDATKTNFAFQGTSDDMRESFGISLQVDGTSLTEGTYSSADYFMPGGYSVTRNSSTSWYDLSDSEPLSKYYITLTVMEPGAIKGSFTGNFFVNTDDENDKVAITEGEFYLKRLR
ncbi:MAG: hypothetical protein QM768_04655 [Agriterribacter sp.]